jgi:hypothetical protein
MYNLNIQTIQPYSAPVSQSIDTADGIADGGFSDALAQATGTDGIGTQILTPMTAREADAQIEDAQSLLYNAMKAFGLDADDSEELLSALQTLINNIQDPEKQAEMNALMPIIAQLLSVQNGEDLTPQDDEYDPSLLSVPGQNSDNPNVYSADATGTLSNTITGLNAEQSGSSSYAQLLQQLYGTDSQSAPITQSNQAVQNNYITGNYPQTAVNTYADAANMVARVTTVTYTELTLTVNNNVLNPTAGANNSLLNQIAALLGLDTNQAATGTTGTIGTSNGNVWSAAQTIIQQFELMTQNGNLTLSQTSATQTGGNLPGTDLQSLFLQMRNLFGLGGAANLGNLGNLNGLNGLNSTGTGTNGNATDLNAILSGMGLLGVPTVQVTQATQTTQTTQTTQIPQIPTDTIIPTQQTQQTGQNQTILPTWSIPGILSYTDPTDTTGTIGTIDTTGITEATGDPALFTIDDSAFVGELSETENGVNGMTLDDLGLMYGVATDTEDGAVTADDTGIVLEDNSVETLVDDGAPGELDYGSVAQNLTTLTAFETQYVAPAVERQTTAAIISQFEQFPLNVGESGSFEVILTPESLGKISIKLNNDNGVITIQLTAEDAKTQAMLFERGEAIQQALRENGIAFERFVIMQPATEETVYNYDQGGGLYGGEPNEENAEEGTEDDAVPEDEESGMTFEELLSAG